MAHPVEPTHQSPVMITRILLSLIPALLLAALPAQDARPEGVVRVGTWNLEHFGGRKPDKWSPNGKRTIEDYARIAKLIHRLDVDVLAVQEIATPLALQQLCEELGKTWDYVIGPSGDYGSYRISPGIVWNTARLDLVQAEELQFPRKLGKLSIFSRLPVAAVFRSRDGKFDFRMLSVHMKASRDAKSVNKRKAEAGHMVNYLKGLNANRAEDHDIFVCGDFNHTYGAPAHEIFTIDSDVRYLETEGSPATIIHFPQPIDHFAITKGIEAELIKGSRRVHGAAAKADKESWRKSYSDHIPVTIDLRAEADQDPDATFTGIKGTELKPQRIHGMRTTRNKTPAKVHVAPKPVTIDMHPIPVGSSVTVSQVNSRVSIKGTLLRTLGTWVYLRRDDGSVIAIPSSSVDRISLLNNK